MPIFGTSTKLSYVVQQVQNVMWEPIYPRAEGN